MAGPSLHLEVFAAYCERRILGGCNPVKTAIPCMDPVHSFGRCEIPGGVTAGDLRLRMARKDEHVHENTIQNKAEREADDERISRIGGGYRAGNDPRSDARPVEAVPITVLSAAQVQV